jgi:hypothetical protein
VSGEQKATAEPQPTPGTVERIRPRQLSQRDPAGLAKAIADSGFWKHIRTPAQAMVVMAAGEELGLTPLAACQGITIIEEKIGYTGNLVATLVKQNPVHDYRVRTKTNERCEIEFGPVPAPGRDESGEWLPWPDAYGTSEFTVEDAQRAELVKPRSNWVKYPRAMCFNRALTEGIRAYCPDITAGTPVYTDEEIREIVHVESEAEVVEGDPAPTLDPARITHLVEGIEIVKPQLADNGINWWDGLNLILGSLGIDSFDFAASNEVAFHLKRLSDEQADVLDAELQRMADEAPEEVDGEVVEAGGANA